MLHRTTYNGRPGPLPIDILLSMQAVRNLGILRRELEDDTAADLLAEDRGKAYLKLLRGVPDKVSAPVNET